MTRQEAYDYVMSMGAHPYSVNGMVDAMMKGFEIAEEKACRFLEDTLFPTVKIEVNEEIRVVNRHEFIDWFKKAIEK